MDYEAANMPRCLWGKMIRALLCAALSVLIGGRLMAQQPAPADGTGAKGSLPIQPVPANNGQAEEIRQLKAAVSHLQEQVKQLSNKSSLEDNQERVPQPIQSIPLFNPLCHDGLPPTKTEDESFVANARRLERRLVDRDRE
jgi:hypothetical protein